MNQEPEFDERRVKRLILWFRVLIAAILLLGLLAATVTDSGKWVDRSGKVMVAASLLLTFLQFRYENQFATRFGSMPHLAEKLGNKKGIPKDEAARVVGGAIAELRVRFEDVRRRVLLHALATAGIGELIAAFGDVAFSAVQQLFCR